MKFPHSILLVEDNPADIIITQRAMRESRLEVDLVVVRDGQEAVEFLLAEAQVSKPHPRPDLILLDLNLPRLAGRELLERIRQHAGLRPVPVIVLTNSNRDDDVDTMYRAGANTYIQKPAEFSRFVEVLRTICNYWLGTAILPPRSS
ncbi:MAG: response regulator [Gemmataceae bacterium]